MTTAELEASVKRAANLLMEAVEGAEAAIAVYSNIGSGLTPAVSADVVAAGQAIQAVITALGSGAASNRARLDKVR